MNYPVDTVAAMQGVHDARQDQKISNELYEKVCAIFREISAPGPVRRNECSYEKLLNRLAKLKGFPYYELSHLWEYLGSSLGSGISVGDNCHFRNKTAI